MKKEVFSYKEQLIANAKIISVLEQFDIAAEVSRFLLDLYQDMGLSVEPEYTQDLRPINETYGYGQGDFFAWVSQDRILGTAAYLLESQRTAYLKRLSTDLDFRGHGLAGRLYREMIWRLKALGITEARFDTLDSFGMVPTYVKSWGFEKYKREQIVTGRGPDEIVYMKKKI